MAAEQRKVLDVPMNINEEYYQISGEILSSFPKFRPPVDLFRFREDIAVLAPYCVKGSRLSTEQVDEVAQLCANGDLFVSRSDHHIYSRHIVKQLDLVLQDNNLKEAEIADICMACAALKFGGTARGSKPASHRRRRMFHLMPKSYTSKGRPVPRHA